MESGAWKRVGADGFIERARSMRPSVNTSAAYLFQNNNLVRYIYIQRSDERTLERYVHLHRYARN